MILAKRIICKAICLIGILSLSQSLYAQDPIATERPTQSIGSLVLPGNSFQFEQGFAYRKDTLVLDGFFRVGISDLAEIRLLTYYDTPSVTIGAKVNLLKDKNYRPGIALKIDLTDGKVSDYRLSLMQKLSDQFSATYNIGYSTEVYNILAIGYTFADRFGTFLEGYIQNDYIEINTGLTFAVNSETQLDITTGSLDFDTMYISAGFARRFMFKKE